MCCSGIRKNSGRGSRGKRYRLAGASLTRIIHGPVAGFARSQAVATSYARILANSATAQCASFSPDHE